MKKVLMLALLLSSALTCFAQESERVQKYVCAGVCPIAFGRHDMIDMTAGWRFNTMRYLGLGSGLHRVEVHDDADPGESNGAVTAVPLFADYVRYFPCERHERHAFTLRIKAGGMIYPSKLPTKNDSDRVSPLVDAQMGMDFALSSNLGLCVGCGIVLSEPCGMGLSVGVRF